MRIAVTYDNGSVWQHFGKTEYFKFYDIEDGKVTGTEVLSTGEAGHGALADFLAANNAETVICGGVGSPMIDRLESFGIKAYPGVTGDADAAVESLLAGTLDTDASAVHDGCHHHHE